MLNEPFINEMGLFFAKKKKKRNEKLLPNGKTYLYPNFYAFGVQTVKDVYLFFNRVIKLFLQS